MELREGLKDCCTGKTATTKKDGGVKVLTVYSCYKDEGRETRRVGVRRGEEHFTKT